MASRRMIDPAIWQSEDFAGFTFRQRVLFVGLFSNADDQGRMPAHPALVRSTVFPYDDIPLDEIQADLDVIAQAECIELYRPNGKPALQILNWWKYQSPQWAYPSKVPTLDDWTDRLRYRRDSKIVTLNWETPGGKPIPDGVFTPPPKPLAKDLPKEIPDPLTCGDRVSIDDRVSIGVSDSNAADAPSSPGPTPAELVFLEQIGAFEDEQDRKDILAMEIQVGSVKVAEAIKWARRKHVKGNDLIQSICTAASKWIMPTGPPSDNGRGDRSSNATLDAIAELEAEVNGGFG